MNKFRIKEVIKEFLFAFFVIYILITIFMLFNDFRLLTFALSFISLLMFMFSPVLVVLDTPYAVIPIILFPVSIYYLYKKFPVSKIKYRKYLLTLIILIWELYGGVALTIFSGGA